MFNLKKPKSIKLRKEQMKFLTKCIIKATKRKPLKISLQEIWLVYRIYGFKPAIDYLKDEMKGKNNPTQPRIPKKVLKEAGRVEDRALFLACYLMTTKWFKDEVLKMVKGKPKDEFDKYVWGKIKRNPFLLFRLWKAEREVKREQKLYDEKRKHNQHSKEKE